MCIEIILLILLIFYAFHFALFLIGSHPASFFPGGGSGPGTTSTSQLLNGSVGPGGLYIPPPSASMFWPLGLRSKPRRGMLRRAVFSDQQRKGLEVAFSKQKYISKPERKKLAQRLGLKDSQVWMHIKYFLQRIKLICLFFFFFH